MPGLARGFQNDASEGSDAATAQAGGCRGTRSPFRSAAKASRIRSGSGVRPSPAPHRAMAARSADIDALPTSTG